MNHTNMSPSGAHTCRFQARYATMETLTSRFKSVKKRVRRAVLCKQHAETHVKRLAERRNRLSANGTANREPKVRPFMASHSIWQSYSAPLEQVMSAIQSRLGRATSYARS